MAQALVRNLEDHVLSALRRKADSPGHSLEQELRAVLTAASSLSPEERVALSRQVRSMTQDDKAQTESAELIREDRDSR